MLVNSRRLLAVDIQKKKKIFANKLQFSSLTITSTKREKNVNNHWHNYDSTKRVLSIRNIKPLEKSSLNPQGKTNH